MKQKRAHWPPRPPLALRPARTSPPQTRRPSRSLAAESAAIRRRRSDTRGRKKVARRLAAAKNYASRGQKERERRTTRRRSRRECGRRRKTSYATRICARLASSPPPSLPLPPPLPPLTCSLRPIDGCRQAAARRPRSSCVLAVNGGRCPRRPPFNLRAFGPFAASADCSARGSARILLTPPNCDIIATSADAIFESFAAFKSTQIEELQKSKRKKGLELFKCKHFVCYKFCSIVIGSASFESAILDASRQVCIRHLNESKAKNLQHHVVARNAAQKPRADRISAATSERAAFAGGGGGKRRRARASGTRRESERRRKAASATFSALARARATRRASTERRARCSRARDLHN